MFLTAEEIATLTGYELPAWQKRWLKSHSWSFEESAHGRPVVLRSYATTKLSGEAQNKEWSPNLAAIRKVA